MITQFWQLRFFSNQDNRRISVRVKNLVTIFILFIYYILKQQNMCKIFYLFKLQLYLHIHAIIFLIILHSTLIQFSFNFLTSSLQECENKIITSQQFSVCDPHSHIFYFHIL